MFFDSHTHLNDDTLFPDRQKHLDDFFALGGKSLVNVGVNHERNTRAIHITKERNTTHTSSEHIFAAIGIHPTETVFGNIKNTDDIEREMIALEKLYHDHAPYIVAIGECGNDAHHGDYTQVKDLQQKLFHAQCLLARRLNVPIMIHSRDNFEDAFEVLQDFTDLKIYFHCRGYSPREITKLANTFPRVRIGFCGNISYPKAQALRDSFQTILELQKTPGGDRNKEGPHQPSRKMNFLLETDAPYLSPQKKRGQTNVPSYVKDIYIYISETFKIPLAMLQKNVQQSFEELYHENE